MFKSTNKKYVPLAEAQDKLRKVDYAFLVDRLNPEVCNCYILEGNRPEPTDCLTTRKFLIEICEYDKLRNQVDTFLDDTKVPHIVIVKETNRNNVSSTEEYFIWIDGVSNE